MMYIYIYIYVYIYIPTRQDEAARKARIALELAESRAYMALWRRNDNDMN